MCRRSRRASVGRDSLCGITMAKSFPTKTRLAGRFFGSQSRRSKAPRKARTAGQSSTVGYRLRRYVSILQMKQILLAPWPFRISRQRTSQTNAGNDALPLPLRLNLNRLPENRSRDEAEEEDSRTRNQYLDGPQGCIGFKHAGWLQAATCVGTYFFNKIVLVPGEPDQREVSNCMREL